MCLLVNHLFIPSCMIDNKPLWSASGPRTWTDQFYTSLHRFYTPFNYIQSLTHHKSVLQQFLMCVLLRPLSHCMLLLRTRCKCACPPTLGHALLHWGRLLPQVTCTVCMSNRHCSNLLLQSLCPAPTLLHWSSPAPTLLHWSCPSPVLLGLLLELLAGQVPIRLPSSLLQREGQGKLKVIVWLPIASLEPIKVLMPANG